MPELCFGIDLGTTNSCIAYLNNGRTTAIPLEEGQGIIPSVVSYDTAGGRFLVGRQARNRRAAFPQA
ncbi:MAG: Hsp70 family protein, partial [Deltaproteobacteria bacterium]|nr:Hsp70 family protein [Deltaproteobacteria bacterium]